jgi:hypothetical protein
MTYGKPGSEDRDADSGRHAGCARELVGAAALLVAVLAAADLFVSLRSAEAEARQWASLGERVRAHDRLVGSVIDLRGLTGLEADSDRPVRVLWVVDGDRCQACLGYLGPWMRLRGLERLEMTVIPIGSPPEDVRAALRVLRATVHSDIDRTQVEEAFGWLPASTKILLDPEGMVLLVDGRHDRASCDGAFERAVESILTQQSP